MGGCSTYQIRKIYAIGQALGIVNRGGEDALHRHLLDMGITPGVKVLLQKTAPMGDPIEIRVRGYELTLRVEEAQKIEVKEAAEI